MVWMNKTGSSIWVRPLLLKLINNSWCRLPTTLMYTTSLWVSIPAKNSDLLLLNPNDQFLHSILQSTPWNQTTTSLNLGGDGYPYKNSYCPLIFISGRLWYNAFPLPSNVVSTSCENIYIYKFIIFFLAIYHFVITILNQFVILNLPLTTLLFDTKLALILLFHLNMIATPFSDLAGPEWELIMMIMWVILGIIFFLRSTVVWKMSQAQLADANLFWKFHQSLDKMLLTSL